MSLFNPSLQGLPHLTVGHSPSHSGFDLCYIKVEERGDDFKSLIKLQRHSIYFAEPAISQSKVENMMCFQVCW